jgi:Tic22-like family
MLKVIGILNFPAKPRCIEMKHILVRGTIGGLLSSIFLTGTMVEAIPEAQILTKLQGIPVFALTDRNGAPLIDSDIKKKNYAGAYFSLKDAQAAFQKIGRDRPDLGRQLQIRPVALSEIYKLQTNKKVDVLFIPSQPQSVAALALAKKKNLSLSKFEGVPLFLGLAGKQPSYLTINQNKKQVIPLFFDREQLQLQLDVFKKNNPSLAATTGIQVLTLEGFLVTLQTNNNPLYDKVMMMPSAEAMELLRSSKATIR